MTTVRSRIRDRPSLQKPPVVAGAVGATLGVLVLLGWASGIQLLTTGLPGGITTKANTAVAMALTGAALVLIARDRITPRDRTWAALIAGVVMVLSFLTLTQDVVGASFGLDELLVHDAAPPTALAKPGRMVPTTAICFMLLGAALLVSARPVRRRWHLGFVAVLSGAVLVVASLTVAGWLSEALAHVHLWSAGGVAFPTGLGLAVLGFGVLALAVRESGFERSLDLMSTAAFAVAVLSLLAAREAAFRTTTRLHDDMASAEHTQEVLREIEELGSSIASLEASQRGFIITGDERLLAGREQVEATMREDFAGLRTLTVDEPELTTSLDRLSVVLGQRVAWVNQTIAIRREQGFEAARERIATGEEAALAGETAALVAELGRSQRAALRERDRSSHAATTKAFLLLPLSSFLSITLLAAGFLVLNRVASDRKRAHRELKDSEERLAGVVGSAMDAIVSVNDQQNIVLFNPAAERMFGFSAAEVLGKPIDLLIPARFRDSHRHQVRRFGDTGATTRSSGSMGTVRGVTASGQEFPIEASISHVTRAGVKLFTVVMRDVTLREQAEQALAEREAQLQRFVEQSPAAVAMFDRDMRYLVASRRWITDYRLEGRPILGRSHYDVLPEIPERWKDIHRRCLAGAVERADEDAFERADGSLQWLRWEVRPWRTAGGEMGGLIMFSEDISGLKQGEIALRESEARFRELAENIDEVFWSTDPEKGRMLYVSPAYEKVWARSCTSLYEAPDTWLDAVHPDDRERVAAAASTLQVKGLYDETYRITRPDGAVRWIRDRAFPIRDAEGRVYRLVGVAQDVTERRSLEQQFQQAQKMEAVGRLAGGIAHDFNNLLTVVSSYSGLLLEELGLDDPNRELVEEIEKASDRAALLTRQMLAFSRQQILETKILDLNVIVADIEKMLRRLIGEDITLSTGLGPQLNSVRADPGQIGQVLMNLAVNARDAMPKGGHLRIETANVELGAAFVEAHPDAQVGRYVMLAVIDDGSGMTADVQAHIFEPFYTTKGVGRGTGLGLAVVHGVVRQSGGHVTVESELGAGTTIRVYLPVVEASSISAEVKRPATQGGGETVLLLEDEDAVRLIAGRVLAHYGYHVISAASGAEALRLTEESSEPIDLLVTDVVMPGLNGREVAERMEARRPGLKVLYMSGYADDAIVRAGVLEAELAFIQKPFTLDGFARKVREVLDEP